MEDNKINTFACWCALPAMRGSAECCKYCLNNPNRKLSEKLHTVFTSDTNTPPEEEKTISLYNEVEV